SLSAQAAEAVVLSAVRRLERQRRNRDECSHWPARLRRIDSAEAEPSQRARSRFPDGAADQPIPLVERIQGSISAPMELLGRSAAVESRLARCAASVVVAGEVLVLSPREGDVELHSAG